MCGFCPEILTELTLNLYKRACLPFDLSRYPPLRPLVTDFIESKVSYEDCCHQSCVLTGISTPIEFLHTILTISNEPIPSQTPDSAQQRISARAKTRAWNTYEDNRLIAGVFRFGVEDWTSIARFVGNGRTRSQASQRWQRGLDPRISRDRWSPTEDRTLVCLVQNCGDKSWTQVAAQMGHRSDVQCRYRYMQILKNTRIPAQVGVRRAHSGFNQAMGPRLVIPRTAQQPMAPPRAAVRMSMSAPKLPAIAQVEKMEEPKEKKSSAEDDLFEPYDQVEESQDLFDSGNTLQGYYF
jgi:nuclear transport factor 2 (NTF2) superfamily protein